MPSKSNASPNSKRASQHLALQRAAQHVATAPTAAAAADDLHAGVRSVLFATLPGRQRRRHVEALMPAAVAALARMLRRRADRRRAAPRRERAR